MHRATIATITVLALTVSVSIGCHPHRASSSSPDAAPVASIASAEAVSASPETVIVIDNAKLAAFGLDLLRVQNTLIASGIPVKPDAPGTFVLTEPRAIEAIAETIVSTVNGAPVRVRDVGQIQRRMKR